jgi:hypothetical protein
LKAGYYADIVIFDPAKVEDHATYEKPHQYSTGMIDVFVNGQQVLKDGEHTGATPGKFVKGPVGKENNFESEITMKRILFHFAFAQFDLCQCTGDGHGLGR